MMALQEVLQNFDFAVQKDRPEKTAVNGKEDSIALTASLDYVCTNLHGITQILNILLEKEVITPFIEDEIESKAGRYTKNKALLNCLLMRKGSLRPFLDVLRSDTVRQSEIANYIEERKSHPGIDEKSSDRHKKNEASGGQVDDSDSDELDIDDDVDETIIAKPIAKYDFNKKRKAKILIINNVEFPKKLDQYLSKCKTDDEKPLIGKELHKILQRRGFKAGQMSAKDLCEKLKNYFDECKEKNIKPVTGKELDKASKWKRRGADKDEEAVISLCEFLFPGCRAGEEENYKENKTADEMTRILTDFAASIPKADSVDAVEGAFIFLLSHGTKADFKGADGKVIHLLDIFKLFSPKNCPGLKGKPKVFFIQACRGVEHDLSTEVEMEIEFDGDEPSKVVDISELDDFLIAFSSGWGKYSMRDPTDGSFFIQMLKRVLEHPDNKGLTIEQVLKKVHNVVRSIFQKKEFNVAKPGCKKEMKKVTQSPGYYSHLSRDLVLVPEE